MADEVQDEYLNDTGLGYFIGRLKSLFVAKETGKGLSSNDYTDAEKQKLSDIAANAQVNVIESVKVNGNAQAITDKAVDITVPTKTSDLTNDSDFQNATQVQALIDTELGEITGIDFQFFDTTGDFPAVGVKGVFYMVPNGGENPDIYDEYVWVTPTGGTNHYEHIGTTAVDLSAYWAKSELVPLTTARIDEILAAVSNS